MPKVETHDRQPSRSTTMTFPRHLTLTHVRPASSCSLADRLLLEATVGVGASDDAACHAGPEEVSGHPNLSALRQNLTPSLAWYRMLPQTLSEADSGSTTAERAGEHLEQHPHEREEPARLLGHHDGRLGSHDRVLDLNVGLDDV